ncbi:N-(5'-phosphoribosyl)anthranilate isomerase [Alphaproteobacteria bacterium 46_93_T64]|nr:N-(5'-phosphoribosyl)anthranilate isomerase [Alphaproteobacteria bacterium 46_93_T64]
MARTQAKICGLNDAASVAAAVEGDAAYIGMVFFDASPRAVNAETAAELVKNVPDAVKVVGLFVDPDDAFLSSVLDKVALDLIQLHGSESPSRVAHIKKQFSVPVMKALKIAEKADLTGIKDYENVADMLLFDAKAPKNMKDALPGGNGLVFDWRMLMNMSFNLPWMLAGGLDATNVQEAVTISGAPCVDTSSGVEISPGNKDVAEISRFLKTVHEI